MNSIAANPVQKEIDTFCQRAMSYPPNRIESWRKRLVALESDHVFLNAYGLGSKPVRKKVFQHFQPQGANIQPVQYFWADPLIGNTIHAQLVDTEQASDCFLRVYFDNKPYSFGCNLAVRPLNRDAILTDGAGGIVLNARVPKESELQQLGIRVRIVNGYMQHWESTHAQLLSITGDQFREVSVDLDPSCWAIFHSDGTADRGPATLDFSIIASVVLTVGGYAKHSSQPTAGKGVLDLRTIEIR